MDFARLFQFAVDRLDSVRVWKIGDLYVASCESAAFDENNERREHRTDPYPDIEQAVSALLCECGLTYEPQLSE
jgi:hypothetical protein